MGSSIPGLRGRPDRRTGSGRSGLDIEWKHRHQHRCRYRSLVCAVVGLHRCQTHHLLPATTAGQIIIARSRMPGEWCGGLVRPPHHSPLAGQRADLFAVSRAHRLTGREGLRRRHQRPRHRPGPPRCPRVRSCNRPGLHILSACIPDMVKWLLFVLGRVKSLSVPGPVPSL